ncbi:MAG: protein-L-isoaspartate O-methyltransferase [Candidatus Methanomethylicota archaeon]|uniref:Protein-L-isoaspartate O-methyltransferase n=1 Tax=Thermoproteota archaeon TaxID=2056631 RepID=A0A497F057_9CREN|nr:MAG: protein-L-isoaspartate O-methyltransferase [Candidatus Verstraetearchaeota archaeon]RLE53043.1 MAG: protein-L-isoaspartate O-methyltransferase [Candidatus Verstraetearchaeota archaeon]
MFEEPFEEQRKRLISRLVDEGVLRSPSVIKAMLSVPRELFVPEQHRRYAYADTPLPTLSGQTISAPHMVAMMCEHLDLKPGHKVLEVGAGSGYHAAVCAEIVAPKDSPVKGYVYAVERVYELVLFARRNLEKAGYADRVTVIHGDGTLGYPEAAPYDRILVTAAAPNIPPPLIEQLRIGGRIVIPIGEPYSIQELVIAEKKEDGSIRRFSAGGCVFVPLIGKYGWSEHFT